MNTQSDLPPTRKPTTVTAGILARFRQVATLLVVQAAILFLAAGTFDWTWAWVFLGISLVSAFINGVFLLRTSPETIAERGQAREMKDWDKIVAGLWSLAQFLALPLAAGLDARFGTTPEFANSVHIAGAFLFAAGLGLFGWAMITNAYFSTIVRIQSERGHKVCRSGPYRFVRHPGYVGALFQSFGVPLLLGSLWALIPGILAATAMVIRTSLEDRTLQSELPGYLEYTQDVRYRLFPGIW